MFDLGEQQYFVWDTASQSRKWRDTLKIFGGMATWATPATFLSLGKKHRLYS